MKTTLTLIPLLAILCGCATTSNQPTITPQRMAVIAEMAAFDGTSLWLLKHPEDRPHFEVAATMLGLLAAGTNATPADVQKVLAGLPVKELQGPEGSILIGNAVILYDAFVREHVNLDANVWLRPVIEALHRGIVRGLASKL